MYATTAKVSQTGQISIPAAVRRRWGADQVIVIDKGDRVIVQPVLPLDQIVGRYADRPGPDTRTLRERERSLDAERDSRR